LISATETRERSSEAVTLRAAAGGGKAGFRDLPGDQENM
jgi:hypothetical protein